MMKVLAILAILGSATASRTRSSVDHVDRAHFFPLSSRKFNPTSNANAHQQNALLLVDGFIYVAYSRHDHALVVARRRAVAGGVNATWVRHVFPSSYTETDPDAHRTANIAVSPNDGRLHVMWGMHASKLRYIVTKEPNVTMISDDEFLQPDLFEPERQFLAPGEDLKKFTYPRMFIAGNDTLKVVWRKGGSGSGDSFLATYNNDKTWSPRYKFIDGFVGVYKPRTPRKNKSRNAYFNDINYHDGIIHASWTWREQARSFHNYTANHDMNYAFSDDEGVTWKNRFGVVVGNEQFRMNLTTPGLMFHKFQYEDRVDNQSGQTVDSSGRVHMIWCHSDHNNDTRRTFHYIKHHNSTEIVEYKRSILDSTIRPKIYAGTNESLYAVTIYEDQLRVFGSNKGKNNWGVWDRLYSSDPYVSAVGQVSDDGKKLYVLAQKMAHNETTDTWSYLNLITIPVGNNSPRVKVNEEDEENSN